MKDEQLSQARGRADQLTQENTDLQARVDQMQEEIDTLKKTSEWFPQDFCNTNTIAAKNFLETAHLGLDGKWS